MLIIPREPVCFKRVFVTGILNKLGMQYMTKEERKEIDPELCAEGLHKFLERYGNQLEYKELAIFYGAISLLYDCHANQWLERTTEKYDAWNPYDEFT